MNKTKVIVVGQGIAGTMLSWFLYKEGIDFVVIDDNISNTPSRTAAGIINPVTGRRVVTVWMDDILLPFAERTYKTMADFLNITAISSTSIIDFFPNPFMKESFLKKISQGAPYISIIDEKNYFSEYFQYEFGVGKIAPAYIVHLQNLLPAWRQFLLKNNLLISSSFKFSELKVDKNQINYQNIAAEKIIFCDGSPGNHNPFFSLLPFALNKGEALILDIPGLPSDMVYKKSMTLAPFGKEGVFWVGTNYLWDFDDDMPTESFRKHTEEVLKSWLKIPFRIVEHKAAIRPATVERRPFVGFHPLYPHVGILNGLGTKGCSLAPYFAAQLVAHITQNAPILPEADVNRFARILSRTEIS
ncbi:tRNA 5-methylaminomethyl-2-thiouridine biosynthesis bifunctional protein MnmC [Mycovorax composti]|uniref:tRNA 5-methylaminomethyl-2-thiouridine biosynthesis bifunctional protein MnmC n=1 Tax=Mycovorax composti TaxID=2962693 RepID=A0ABZ2EJ74_9BACT